MKRAEVWKNRYVDDWWSVVIWDGEPPTRHLPIPDRDDSESTSSDGLGFPTYAEALAWALEKTGLDVPEPHREAP